MRNCTNKKNLKFGLLLLLLIGSFQSYSVTYYSRISGGSWALNSTWSTVGYGNATNTGTFPKAGDIVFIGNGHNINIASNAACANLTIGQGLSGMLSYSSFALYSLTITGNLTVNVGATLRYIGNATRSHDLIIGGNLTNNGLMDLYNDSDDFVNILFNGKTNSVVSGNGVYDLNTVKLTKSLLNIYYLDVQSSSFETGIRSLDATLGTYIHNNSSLYSVNPSATAYTILPNVIFKVPQGTLQFSQNFSITYLEGRLDVTGGNVVIGLVTGTNGLRYNQVGTIIPQLNITGGQLTVYGGITYQTGSTTSGFHFNMSGGDALLNSGTIGTSNEAFKVNDNASSSFTMSNGTITIEKTTKGAATLADFDICGSNGLVNVTGGNVKFGNNFTPNNTVFKFTPYSTAILPNIRISGQAASTNRLRPIANSTSDANMLSLVIEANKTFDVRSLSGTTGDARTIKLVDNFDGLNALWNDGNFIQRSSTVLMQGGEGLWMSGATTTTFYNLTINNSFGVSLANPINVSNSLSLIDGVLYSDAINKVTCLTTGSANIGSSIAYIDGPFVQKVAASGPTTINIPIGKNNAYRPLILTIQHTNATNVDYTSEVIHGSARTLGFALPPSLSLVSAVRYYTINRSVVANLASARLTSTYGNDDVVTDATNLRLARDNGASAWVDIGGVGSANGVGNITSSSFSGFNTTFTLANMLNGSNPLPVEWLSFNVERKGVINTLSWATASEKNADYFDVQRKIGTADFINIGRVSAVGNSIINSNYSFNDQVLTSSNIYYRLKQVDKDGEFTYSELRSISNSKQIAFSAFPNPSYNKQVSISISEDLGVNSQLSIFDLFGRVVYEQLLNETKDARIIPLDLRDLSHGTYFVTIHSNGVNISSQKLSLVN